MGQNNQQGYQHETSNNIQAGEEIIKGANNEDQLDKLKDDAVTDGLPANSGTEHGTQPSTGDEHLHVKSNNEEPQDSYIPDSGSPQDVGGITNLSLDQLIDEGDNNNS